MLGKSLFIGETIELTALDPEKDAAALSAWTHDQKFSRYLFNKPSRPFAVHEVKKKVKEDLKAADEKKNTFIFAVRKKGQADLVALIELGPIQGTQQVGRFMLNFASPEHLREFGAELIQMALRYGFMELSLHRIWTCLPSWCVDEVQLFESAGFLRETQRREACFYEGRYYDELGYALLKPDYKKQKAVEVAA